MDKVFLQATKRTTPKILALAKNYVAPGSSDVPTQPLIFSKPHSSILYKGEKLILNTKAQVNYEIELGVMIGKSGKNIRKQQAMDHVGGYFLCLDMTEWDMQTLNRKNGFPWEIGKGFDGFLPISDFIDKSSIKDPDNVNLKLQINERSEVDDTTKNMYYKVKFNTIINRKEIIVSTSFFCIWLKQIDHIIEFISQYMTLNQGDLILTGTPKLAPVQNGDKLNATLNVSGKQLASIAVEVVRNV